MKKYFIKFGVDGYSTETEVIEAKSVDEANDEAYYKAKYSYESYEGCGVPSYHEICEDEGLNPEDEEDKKIANEIYNSSVEDHIDYSAVIYVPEEHDDYLY